MVPGDGDNALQRPEPIGTARLSDRKSLMGFALLKVRGEPFVCRAEKNVLQELPVTAPRIGQLLALCLEIVQTSSNRCSKRSGQVPLRE